MATYKSDDVTLGASADKVFAKLDNLEGLGEMIKNAPADMIPDDKRELLEGITVTADTITFPAGPVGALTLRKAGSVAPTLIRLEGDGGPVPMSMMLNIIPVSDECCRANIEIELQIPAMLKPMVNGPMKKMTSEFANMLRAVPFN